MTDKDIKNRIRDIETQKIHRCAEYLKSLGYFKSEVFTQALREYGVARGYFEQLYHLDWKYVWERECSMTFEEFLEDVVSRAKCDYHFQHETLNTTYYQNEYRLNGNMIDKYQQEYRWCVAFKKKDRLN